MSAASSHPNVNEPMYEWQDLPWKEIERTVFKLQKRIYQASKASQIQKVHKLQRLLLTSWSARCLAVRRVTQDNRGKHTAGVDGVKSLKPAQRIRLVQTLRIDIPVKPTRRVWIPKASTSEKRPLGIPTMYNRAAQALVALALEPEWEAKFEPNSYGFRPGRSCHDAIAAIFNSLSRKAKYVLDADIAKCFDRINHQALLEKLQTFPKLRQVIKNWLEAGVVDRGELFPTKEGTPQGGVCSPLLMNVALHGLETAIVQAYPNYYKTKRWRPTVVRYADDFVVLHPDRNVIEQIKQQVSDWLAPLGLELKPSKTRITHTLHSLPPASPQTAKQEAGEKAGFDFLGFTIRHFSQGKTHSARAGNRWGASANLGFKLLIRPSKKAIARHFATIKQIIRRNKTASQADLIHKLNLVIRGWTRYFSTVAASTTFSKLEHQMFLKLASWAKRRHSKQSWGWISRKYWRLETGSWEFTDRDKASLYRYYQTPIRRHIKVQETKSVYDGDWLYWATRLSRHPELTSRVAYLLAQQKGRCGWCGLYFKNEDLKEVDHNKPLIFSSDKSRKNWQLLHRHCHDQKTAKDGSLIGRGIRNKNQMVEEPCVGKLTSTVLKTSRCGDASA